MYWTLVEVFLLYTGMCFHFSLILQNDYHYRLASEAALHKRRMERSELKMKKIRALLDTAKKSKQTTIKVTDPDCVTRESLLLSRGCFSLVPIFHLVYLFTWTNSQIINEQVEELEKVMRGGQRLKAIASLLIQAEKAKNDNLGGNTSQACSIQ